MKNLVEITKKLLGCSDPWRGDQDQLPPVAAGGEQLGALVEDGGRLVEHDVPDIQEEIGMTCLGKRSGQRYNSWFWDSQTPGLPDSRTSRLRDSQTPGSLRAR